MTNLADELKRRARLIAADVVAPHDCALRDNYLSGRADNSPAVRAALAALRPEPAPDVVEAATDALKDHLLNREGMPMARTQLRDAANAVLAALSQSHDVANHSSDARNMVDVAGLVEAVQDAARWFEEYAEGHSAAGKTEKAMRNIERAKRMRSALGDKP